MSAAGRPQTSLLSPIVAIGLVAISMLSLVAYFALSAYAPDFRSADDGGAHAQSGSAIGYEGLRILLDAARVPNAIDRGQRPAGVPNLVILTPPPLPADTDALEKALHGNHPGPVLIVMPKWAPLPDPIAYGRVMKGGLIDRDLVAGILKEFSDKTRVDHRNDVAAPNLIPVSNRFSIIPANLAPIDSLQTISGKDWLPLIKTDDGRIVLARYSKRWVYVLSDPDFVNTHGLHDLPTAAFAVALIRRLRLAGHPVLFDVTLNGMGRYPSILHDAFAPPFLGATLCAILAAILIGYHAAVRFGSPPPDEPVYARGKTALVANAADMIRMLRREPNMATRYASTTRNLVLRALGIRRQMDAQDSEALIATLERGHQQRFAPLLAQAEHLKHRGDLVALANRLYDWRQEMLHARK
ncbi:MAG: hypothetical protein ABSD74_20065 [Rhizomicrobium sp.]|jgi:hypothetical protein